MNYVHLPVLKDCILETLVRDSDTMFLDCTLGEGGHSEAVLNRYKNITVIGLDRDREILQVANNRLKPFGNRFSSFNCNFIDIDKLQIENVDSALIDLGISVYHYKVSKRGFTFNENEKLDMRLDDSGISVYDIINSYPEERLVQIFFEYGEERFAKNIARNIVKERKNKKIETTFQLVEIVERSIPKKYQKKNINCATQVFQALRIEANSEFENIKIGIPKVLKTLKKNGRLGVITFHSLEDRIVKKIFNDLNKSCICPPKVPQCICNKVKEVEIIGNFVAGEDEIKINPPSRSARLRIVEKI